MMPIQSKSHSERGSVMVEFALVVSILFLILFGIIQFGMVFNAQLSLNYAAREGARLAALPGGQSNSQIISSMNECVPPYITLSASNISFSPAIRTRGQPVAVTISYTYAVPVTMGVLPDHYDLSAKAVMMAGI